MVAAAGLACAGSALFAAPGLVDYVRLGRTDVHWSRFVLAALTTVIFAQLATTALLLRFVRALDRKLTAFHGEGRA